MKQNKKSKCAFVGNFLRHKYSTPDGELGASLRYLSQKFTMVTPEAKATLNDIATEECGCVCCQQKGRFK
ncbi:MAG TPA: manganese catalase family protein [Candidatus Coprocola pullicola]|nr:manganese catalase family protein [Candidatus Coprocola pullicola]